MKFIIEQIGKPACAKFNYLVLDSDVNSVRNYESKPSVHHGHITCMIFILSLSFIGYLSLKKLNPQAVLMNQDGY
jgi:hypothetical protein